MGENLKRKGKCATTYMVCGTDGKNLTVTAAKEQPAVENIPGIPMKINVDIHMCEILPNGEIVRKGIDGKKLGSVTNPAIAKKLQKEAEKMDGTTR